MRKDKSRVNEAKEIETSMKTEFKGNIDFNKRSFTFTEKQKQLISMITNPMTNAIFVAGPAGCSKTYVSVYGALLSLQNSWKNSKDYEEHESIIYVRSVVESASRSLGALPGSAEEKFDPFMMPLEDKLEELVMPASLSNLRMGEYIDAMPVNFVRGASWRNKVIIVDESQNMTLSEITTLMTRVGEGSKIIFCGDPMQADIRDSGFSTAMSAFEDPESASNGIYYVKFEDHEIFRSEVLKFIVKKLAELKANNS